MAWPIQVAAKWLSLARGYLISGVAVGNIPRRGLAACESASRSRSMRSVSRRPGASLFGHGL